MPADRPLTPAQERALKALAEFADDDLPILQTWDELAKRRGLKSVRYDTVMALVRSGHAQRIRHTMQSSRYRLSDLGRRWLAEHGHGG